ncbi:MAG: hypothetical protein R3D68_10690 [Hyphomicrobiaceae bacterium]
MAHYQENDAASAACRVTGQPARPAISKVLVVLFGAALLAGCSQSLGGAELPSLDRGKRPLLSKAEQQKVIGDLAKAKEEEIAAAERRIERGR